MTITLLLDLDDTLLANSIDQFLPAYLQALAGHLSAFGDPARIINALMAGTRRMLQNRQPDCSLSEVFDSVFYPLLGVQKSQVEASIETFYRDVYPGLRPHTQPADGGVALVTEAFERGYRVAIATNPLFPATAIRQRLEWAGLPPEQYPFSLVTSYENFHFTKPHLAYFAETLGRLGWPEGPVVVVGNDYKAEILPALQLGLPAYWLNDGTPPADSGWGCLGSGKLGDFFKWLDACEPGQLEPDFSTPEAMLAVLQSTPAILNSLCIPQSLHTLADRPQPDEWSPTEILCHLRDVESEVNLPRLRKVVTGKNPFIPGMDTDRWAAERQYREQDGHRALQRFSAARQRSIRLLEELHPDDWLRPARHAIFGPTTLKEMVGITAGHDRLHLRQLRQLIG